jgi:hypothetical protein
LARCEVPGCFCEIKTGCEHVVGRNESETEAVDQDAFFAELGIAVE